MAGEHLVELKFRLADVTDIGPNKYGPDTTVASPKEKILAHWPRGYPFTSVLMIGENNKTLALHQKNKTLAESRLPVGELPEGIITMHVVLRLPLSDKNNSIMLPRGVKWVDRLASYLDSVRLELVFGSRP
ncbi:hypothetical protein GQ457_12G014950 [Hibiscus cannabinus]